MSHNDAEHEADEFASEQLVPSKAYVDFSGEDGYDHLVHDTTTSGPLD